MSNITAEKIVTVYLKYGGKAQPLKDLAFSQLVLKALSLSKKPLTLPNIRKTVSKLVGCNLTKTPIEESLKWLVKDNKVSKKGENWKINKKTFEHIQSEFDTTENVLSKVLLLHFPQDISSEKLTNWFYQALSDFFGYYSDEWVESICKKTKVKLKKAKTIAQILQPSIKTFDVKDKEEELVKGFTSFLQSDDLNDHELLMNIGLAMFSARLVAANTGADPIAIEELKDAKLILDTNILVALNLEAHGINKSVKSLEKALLDAGVTLVYTAETKEEYNRARIGRKNETMKWINIYPKEVIENVNDTFIATAHKRGCKNPEDFERFFDSLQELPSTLGENLEINLEENQDTKEIEVIAKKDAKLKKKLQEYCLKFRPPWRNYPKSPSALNHDAVLIHIAENYRKEKNKCWILTFDRGLQACSSHSSGPHKIPTVLSMEALIQIMAVNSVGTGGDATNFAPLLSNILLNRCLPPKNTYIIQDLNWLYNLNQDVANYAPEKIEEIANYVANARMQGIPADDKKLQLTINRKFQDEKIKLDEKLDEARERVQAAESKLTNAQQEKEESDKKLLDYAIEKIKSKAKIKLARRLIVGSVISISVGAIVYYLYFQTEFGQNNNIYGYLLAIIPPLIMLIVWALIKPIKQYNKSIERAPEEAKKELV